MPFITKLKKFYKKYERVLIPGMLIVGVAVDFITFRTIKISSAFIILAIYWMIAGATIIFMNSKVSVEQKERNFFARYYQVIAPLVIQFTFGATLSASFIFYWFSGSFSASWPFMILIAFLMISNETLRHYFMRQVIQVGVYYFITLSLLSLMVPYLFNSISAYIFVLSGVLSLIIAYGYVRLLARFCAQTKDQNARINIIVCAIFMLMNILYFTNLIPPIPLSLTEAGVYHHIESSNGGYILEVESQNLFEKIIPGETIHIPEGDPVYVYSAIFAPFDLNTTIVHQWQHFDSSSKRWVTKDELSFTIYGGREEGYRGYSQKTSLSEGRWRVRVQTTRGQTIGIVKFKIKFTDEEEQTLQIIK